MVYTKDWPVIKREEYPAHGITAEHRQSSEGDLYVVNHGAQCDKVRALMQEKGYWKLHLGVPDKDGPLTREIVSFLSGHPLAGEFKVGAGGDFNSASGITVYVGHHDDMARLAKELDEKFSARLPGDIAPSDLRVRGNIAARFCCDNKKDYVQYGLAGIAVSPMMKQVDIWEKNPAMRQKLLPSEFRRNLRAFGGILIGDSASRDALPAWAQRWMAGDFDYVRKTGMQPDLDARAAPSSARTDFTAAAPAEKPWWQDPSVQALKNLKAPPAEQPWWTHAAHQKPKGPPN